MNEPLSPWDAFKSVVSSLTLADATWIAIGIAGVFLFYAFAVARKKRDEANWKGVLFWIIALLGWVFIMYMVTFKRIMSGGPWALLVLAASAVGITSTVAILTRKTRLWERIASGAIIAIIGFGILASFGRGYQTWGYALTMGLTLGLILGMFWSARRAWYLASAGSVDDLDGITPKEKSFTKKKVSEI